MASLKIASFYIHSAFIFQGMLGLLASVRPNSLCPEDAYNACLAPIIEQVTTSNSAFPYFNDQQLDSLCSACDGLKPCFDKVDMRQCDHLELLYIEGVKKTCNYFCIEGPDYRKHRSCFNNSELQNEGSRCNYTFYRQRAQQASLVIENGGVRGPATSEDRSLWCEYVSEFISCMKDAVVQHCSEKAGEWVMNINLQYYHPIMESMECKTGSKVGVAVIFGVAVGLFVTMMVVIVTSIVCRRKQRGNFNNTSSSTKNSSKNQNSKENGNDLQGSTVQEIGKSNAINMKQYYPEGESLLSSETSTCQKSANDDSTKNTDVINEGEGDLNSTGDKDDAYQQDQPQKRLLISDV